MAVVLDFRISLKMHIKINVFMGFLPKYIYDHVTAQTIPTIKQLEMQMTQNKEFAKVGLVEYYSPYTMRSGTWFLIHILLESMAESVLTSHRGVSIV